MSDPIPLVDLGAQHREIDSAAREDLQAVFDSTAFVGGPDVERFEHEYARFCGVEHCVGVGNGTDAVELALRACHVGPGHEVIIPANTFVATAEAVCRAGATPVLVDVEKDTLLMDPGLVAEAVTPRTRAVVPVHLYGQLAPVEDIAAAAPGVPIVEDAAQSHGATCRTRVSGSLGTVGATSFYPGKNLGAAGDAGAVTTDDAEIAEQVRLLGAHGSRTKYLHEVLGFNSRLDTVQAVVLRHKLRRLADWNAARREAAARYDAMLAGLPGVVLPTTRPGNDHVWHLYVIRVANRDAVLCALHGEGIGAGIHYPYPIHLTEAFKGLEVRRGAHPVAEEAADEIVSLPIYPHITERQQRRVVEALRRALRP